MNIPEEIRANLSSQLESLYGFSYKFDFRQAVDVICDGLEDNLADNDAINYLERRYDLIRRIFNNYEQNILKTAESYEGKNKFQSAELCKEYAAHARNCLFHIEQLIRKPHNG